MAEKFGVVAGDNGRIYKMNLANSEYDQEVSGIVTDEELASALAGKADTTHSHPTHGDINFTGSVSADGDVGLTGQKTLGGYVFTFKKGLLVGFQPV